MDQGPLGRGQLVDQAAGVLDHPRRLGVGGGHGGHAADDRHGGVALAEHVVEVRRLAQAGEVVQIAPQPGGQAVEEQHQANVVGPGRAGVVVDEVVLDVEDELVAGEAIADPVGVARSLDQPRVAGRAGASGGPAVDHVGSPGGRRWIGSIPTGGQLDHRQGGGGAQGAVEEVPSRHPQGPGPIRRDAVDQGLGASAPRPLHRRVLPVALGTEIDRAAGVRGGRRTCGASSSDSTWLRAKPHSTCGGRTHDSTISGRWLPDRPDAGHASTPAGPDRHRPSFDRARRRRRGRPRRAGRGCRGIR